MYNKLLQITTNLAASCMLNQRLRIFYFLTLIFFYSYLPSHSIYPFEFMHSHKNTFAALEVLGRNK